MELLEKYTFIALDNFRAILQNRDISNRLEAWLVFLSVDDPEWIERLVREYPEFRPLYQEVYELCRNLEEVMGMYSRELQELDEGTIQYMIDEMQEQLKEKDDRLRKQEDELKEKDSRLKEQEGELKEKDGRLREQEDELKEKDGHLKKLEGELKETNGRLREQEDALKEVHLQMETMRRRIRELENAAR